VLNVMTRTDERRGNEIDSIFNSEFKIMLILFGKGWKINGNAWQIDTFVFAKIA
jgi:hypothetical protein